MAPVVPPQPLARTSVRAGLEDIRADDLAHSLRQAGWSCEPRVGVTGGPFQSLSWGNLRTLAAAGREKLGFAFAIQPDAAMRNAWMRQDIPYGSGKRRWCTVKTPLPVGPPSQGESFRVLLTGDTGDASEAQRAVALQLAGRASRPGSQMHTSGVAALLIQSDIVYPAGAGDEYREKFFAPYDELLSADPPVPIYTVPGNHDWDDGSLIGFMSRVC